MAGEMAGVRTGAASSTRPAAALDASALCSIVIVKARNSNEELYRGL